MVFARRPTPIFPSSELVAHSSSDEFVEAGTISSSHRCGDYWVHGGEMKSEVIPSDGRLVVGADSYYASTTHALNSEEV
jgi:hypothetical protein